MVQRIEGPEAKLMTFTLAPTDWLDWPAGKPPQRWLEMLSGIPDSLCDAGDGTQALTSISQRELSPQFLCFKRHFK